MSNPDAIPKVFLCYAREDNDRLDPHRGPWLDRLRTQLGQFERGRLISVFSDLNIPPGEAWDAEIHRRLEEASVVVVLVSDALLNSSYVAEREMPVILARAALGELRVIPFLLNHCAPEAVPFEFTDPSGALQERRLTDFQMVGSLAQPLISLPPDRQNELLLKVAKAVCDHATELRQRAVSAAVPPVPAVPPASRPPPHRSEPEPRTDDSIPADAALSLPASGSRRLQAVLGAIAILVVVGIVAALLHRRTGPTDRFPISSMPFTNSLGMVFVLVPGVAVRFSIWETRVQDYEAFAHANEGTDSSWKNPIFAGVPVTPGPTHPVVNVSWEDAKQFCTWLTEKELKTGVLKAGQRYRLPTDREWSWAVGLTNEVGATPKDRDKKVGDVYPWGTQWPPPHGAGNFADNSFGPKFRTLPAIEGYRDGYATTSPVGEFSPLQGLFDLSGNVWEWCEDWYDDKQNSRVLRGGSWGGRDPRSLLSSCRNVGGPGRRDFNIGFRVVLVGDGSAR